MVSHGPRHLGIEHSALLPFHCLGLGSTEDRGNTETPFLAVSWSRGHRFHACSHSGGDGERLLGASTNSPGSTLLQNRACCCRWLSGQLQRSCTSLFGAEGVTHAIEQQSHISTQPSFLLTARPSNPLYIHPCSVHKSVRPS